MAVDPITQDIQQSYAKLTQLGRQDALDQYLASTPYTAEQIAAALPEFSAANLQTAINTARERYPDVGTWTGATRQEWGNYSQPMGGDPNTYNTLPTLSLNNYHMAQIGGYRGSYEDWVSGYNQRQQQQYQQAQLEAASNPNVVVGGSSGAASDYLRAPTPVATPSTPTAGGSIPTQGGGNVNIPGMANVPEFTMPQLGQGIGGMLSGMQGGGNVNIPGMANVPEFTMPQQPSFDPTKYQANPYLGQMGQSITSQVTENLLRNVMPGIRSAAQAAGGFGGSRQGVVEANAIKDASKSISDSLTGMYFGDYTNAMNRNLQQYGMDQNFNMGLGQLGLNAQNAARNYNLGVGQLALGNQNSNQNYNLGLGQLALGNQNSLQNFYSTNRGQDLQQTALGANLFQQGNQGWLSQGQGMLGLGQTQQQAPWQVINNANAGLGQWSGYGTTTSANQGGGAQGALGGALAGGQLGSLWGTSPNAAGGTNSSGWGTGFGFGNQDFGQFL